jgi:hypothetical protein
MRQGLGRKTVWVALLAAVALALSATAAFADAPSPDNDVDVSVAQVANGVEVTISGTWQWPTHKKDCNRDRWGVGWAVDWKDPSQPGNFLATLNGTPISVGAASSNSRNPADNSVHAADSAPRCGSFNGSFNTGTWGPISHVYPGDQDSFQFCVVTYDLHGKPGDGAPKDPIAAGSHHNKDNSVEANSKTPAGNGCSLHTTEVPAGTIGLIGLAGLAGLGFVGIQWRRRRNKPALSA